MQTTVVAVERYHVSYFERSTLSFGFLAFLSCPVFFDPCMLS